MTLDEAIAYAYKVAAEQSGIATELLLSGTDASEYIKCKREHEQLAEWLEELKSYRASVFTEDMIQKLLKEERNKAIDDFANRMSSKVKYEIDDCADELLWIEEIVKQLKEGA